MMKLGVNIDHVATIREARKTFEPDPVQAALLCEKAGADGIVCHLRKDRRHINDDDLNELKRSVTTRLNMEMSTDEEIVQIACRIKPDQTTLVPENRQEVTTEGGLDVVRNFDRIKEVVERLLKEGIEVSLFIDPEKEQIEKTVLTGAKKLEFHTGRYAEEFNSRGNYRKELENLEKMVKFGKSVGLSVSAGHGLNYLNTRPVAGIAGIYELNIGHSIISKAVFEGITAAVKQMKELIA